MCRLVLPLVLILLAPGCRRTTENAPATSPNSVANQRAAETHANRNVSTRDRKVATDLIHPLIDPAKLATLGDRGTNARIQKITAILWDAKQKGHDPGRVAAEAAESIGWGGTEKGRLTAAAMVRNLTILERLGSTTPGDLEDMRHGRTATVRKGPYAGEILSVDHIIPRAVAPELDNVIANLELMPLSVNRMKSDKIGQRQVAMGKEFHDAGLLSDAGFRSVMDAKQ